MSEVASFSYADQVWNRAAMESGGAAPRSGDAALASLLRFHNYAMNGGVAHALESLSPQELAACIQGYLYFGFSDVVEMLSRRDLSVESEEVLDNEYGALIPSDEVLVQVFEKVFRSSPDLFSPLVAAQVHSFTRP